MHGTTSRKSKSTATDPIRQAAAKIWTTTRTTTMSWVVASCFTLNIHNTRMPKGFKLTAEIFKFDGTQDPRLWLEDYLIVCNCQGGNQFTAMQYLQLMLTGSARGWLQSIPKNSFSTWEEFEEAFVKNFLATYLRPGTLVQLKACKQHRDESLRAYIARWTLLRNSIGVVSEERAIKAFQRGVWRQDLREPYGRIQPNSIIETMKVANQWVDGEDSV